MNHKGSYLLSRNIVLAFGALAAVALLYFLVPGYRWAVEEVGFRNLNLIKRIEAKREAERLPPLNVHEKRAFKIENYYYLQMLNSQTPQNAVVLLPPKKVVENSRHIFMSEAEWVAYFIYPRLCISEDELKAKPEMLSRISHVAIIKGWGYQYLKYEPENREEETVLPINKPNE